MGAIFFKKKKENFKQVESSFWELEAKDIDQNLINFSKYQGCKCIMIINVASNCGYTKKHYQELKEIYSQFHDKGLEILAFPCNNFMNQEPECGVNLKQLIQEKYLVTFPLFEKIDVNGQKCHPVYRFLRTKSSLYNSQNQQAQEIPWNFSKFLVDRNGQVQGFYDPDKSPKQIASIIEKMVE